MPKVSCTLEEAQRIIAEFFAYQTVIGYPTQGLTLLRNDTAGVSFKVVLRDGTTLAFSTPTDSGELTA